MSSDVFEKNIGKLVRQAALPDGAAAARARFLREAEPASRSRAVAIAAAALLIAALIYGASRPKPVAERPVPNLLAQPEPVPPPVTIFDGDELLQLTFKVMPADRTARSAFAVSGRTSKLPDNLVVRVRAQWLEESFDGRRLAPLGRGASATTPVLERGVFETTWEDEKAGPLQVDVSAPDALQEREVLTRMKSKESERNWSLTVQVGDQRLLPRVDAQLAELADFIREARTLVDRAEKESALEEQFQANTKALAGDTRRLLARLNGFASAGLYPAGTGLVHASVQNLLGALPNFAFKEGKFAGAPDYHQKTPGNERVAFSFEGLREWLGLASLVAGREFDLWVLRDLARGGPRPELTDALKRHAQRPGVAEFADRLLGPADLKLADEVRSVVK